MTRPSPLQCRVSISTIARILKIEAPGDRGSADDPADVRGSTVILTARVAALLLALVMAYFSFRHGLVVTGVGWSFGCVCLSSLLRHHRSPWVDMQMRLPAVPLSTLPPLHYRQGEVRQK